ncbi:MAG TPA: endonuclease/exonuclease/phosphatase family protein [Candidatus Saccharimonadales bacterium]|nr:endonuclease/exonuclease/phosphatase family protein [Candidatus Saccharimonadales bacterium]
MENTINILGWNVNQGGFDRRHIANFRDMTPERETAIQQFIIQQQQEHRVTTASLIDTYGWRERYGGDEGIAAHLGFRAAHFVELADSRIDNILGPGAGLTFTTHHEIEESVALDLDNRQGIRSIIKLGGKTLQIATLYLDDMREDVRLHQLRAGLDGLEDEPTMLVGDFNALRPHFEGASLTTKAHDLSFRTLAFAVSCLPKQETLHSILSKINKQQQSATIYYYRTAISNLNQRQVIPYLEQQGWHDADPNKHATFRKLGGIGLGVDYAFYNGGVQLTQADIIPAYNASDHDALRVTAIV